MAWTGTGWVWAVCVWACVAAFIAMTPLLGGLVTPPPPGGFRITESDADNGT